MAWSQFDTEIYNTIKHMEAWFSRLNLDGRPGKYISGKLKSILMVFINCLRIATLNVNLERGGSWDCKK